MPFASRNYQSFFSGGGGFANPADTSPVTLGNLYRFSVAGHVLGLQYLRDLIDDGEHIGMLRRFSDASTERVVHFRRHANTGSGPDRWEQAYFAKRMKVNAGDSLYACVWFEAGQYSRILDYGAAGDVTHGHIVFPQNTPLGFNGLYSYYNQLVPILDYRNSAYALDVIFWDGIS